MTVTLGGGQTCAQTFYASEAPAPRWTSRSAVPGQRNWPTARTVYGRTALSPTPPALISTQTGRLLMFHAGAVAHPVIGRSLVFIAEGGTGKTTLARPQSTVSPVSTGSTRASNASIWSAATLPTARPRR